MNDFIARSQAIQLSCSYLIQGGLIKDGYGKDMDVKLEANKELAELIAHLNRYDNHNLGLQVLEAKQLLQDSLKADANRRRN
jgi:hypothetical protein